MPPRRNKRAVASSTSPKAAPPAAKSARRAAGRTIEPTVSDQRAHLAGFFRGLHASHLLSFAIDTGALQQIAHAGQHGLNADELSENAGWVPEYTRAFLEAAFALGLLDLASEAGVTPRARYRLAPHMADLLADESSRHYLGEYPRLHVLTARDYARLAELFRSGKTYPFAVHGEEFLRSSAAATRSLPDYFLTEFLPDMPALRRRLEDGAHVLDIGCGAGWTVARLAEEFPRCRVIGIDAEPNAVEMAKSLLVMRQLTRRAEARLVHEEELDYEAEFDLVTFFLVLHTIPGPNKASALMHAQRALKRGGLLLILDQAYPESPDEFRDPDRSQNVLAQWLEGTWGHRYSTRTEYHDLLASTGFVVRQELSSRRYHFLLAEKKA